MAGFGDTNDQNQLEANEQPSQRREEPPAPSRVSEGSGRAGTACRLQTTRVWPPAGFFRALPGVFRTASSCSPVPAASGPRPPCSVAAASQTRPAHPGAARLRLDPGPRLARTPSRPPSHLETVFSSSQRPVVISHTVWVVIVLFAVSLFLSSQILSNLEAG